MESGDLREIGEGRQRAWTVSYKLNNFCGCDIQHGDYSLQYCIAYLKLANKADLKYYYHAHTPTKRSSYVMDMLIGLTVVNISYCRQTSNHQVVSLNYVQF